MPNLVSPKIDDYALLARKGEGRPSRAAASRALTTCLPWHRKQPGERTPCVAVCGGPNRAIEGGEIELVVSWALAGEGGLIKCIRAESSHRTTLTTVTYPRD